MHWLMAMTLTAGGDTLEIRDSADIAGAAEVMYSNGRAQNSMGGVYVLQHGDLTVHATIYVNGKGTDAERVILTVPDGYTVLPDREALVEDGDSVTLTILPAMF
ncbi:hypothetical protein [Roseicyclus sp.]|uniref:hypothetical protein n=1 Tax=Roseicyclus sp. TaxID=1914329 RepID=UPI003F6CFB1B